MQERVKKVPIPPVASGESDYTTPPPSSLPDRSGTLTEKRISFSKTRSSQLPL